MGKGKTRKRNGGMAEAGKRVKRGKRGKTTELYYISGDRALD